MSQVEHQIEVIQAHGRDREISIRIFLVWCRAIVEEVLKTFQTARKGSQDMTAGNNFLRQNGDPTITEEAKGFEELDFRQNKRSASYITGWIFYVLHQTLGALSK